MGQAFGLRRLPESPGYFVRNAVLGFTAAQGRLGKPPQAESLPHKASSRNQTSRAGQRGSALYRALKGRGWKIFAVCEDFGD